MRAELVERRVELACCGLFAGKVAIDVEADSGRLIPCKREVYPFIRLREAGHRVGDARAVQVDVGHEGVEAVAVVVDAEPDHVPAAVVAVSDAEDWEFGLVHCIPGAPVEGEGSTLGVDVARRPIGEQLVIPALQVGPLGPAGQNFHVLVEVRFSDTASCIIGLEAVVAGKVKEQPRLFGWALICSCKVVRLLPEGERTRCEKQDKSDRLQGLHGGNS